MNQGIFIEIGGQLFKVIDGTDTLDGKEVEGLSMGGDALSGVQLAFRVDFEDGSSGIYIATIPEPSTALLISLGLAGLGLARRREH